MAVFGRDSCLVLSESEPVLRLPNWPRRCGDACGRAHAAGPSPFSCKPPVSAGESSSIGDITAEPSDGADTRLGVAFARREPGSIEDLGLLASCGWSHELQVPDAAPLDPSDFVGSLCVRLSPRACFNCCRVVCGDQEGACCAWFAVGETLGACYVWARNVQRRR